MTQSLKEKNKVTLILIVSLNLVLLYALIGGIDIFSGESIELFQQTQKLLLAGLGGGFVGVLNALVDAEIKAKIVFLRFANPLPGSRAFNADMLAKDSRIAPEMLRAKIGTVPSSPQQQNSLWYQIYKKHCEEISVIEAHKNFLFTRDYAVLSLIMIVVISPLGFWLIPEISIAMTYATIIIIQFILAMIAARNNGNRLVLTVLAIESTV